MNACLSLLGRDRRSVRRALGFVLTAALILRLGYIFVGIPLRLRLDPRPLEQTDSYLDLARGLVETGSYSDQQRAPLYPGFLAAILWMTHGNLTAPLVAQALVETATIGLIFLFARQLAGSDITGLLAASIYALDYTAINLTSKYLTEPIYIFLVTGFVWSFWQLYRKPTLARAGRTGATFGLVLLTRPDAQWFAIVLILMIGKVCRDYVRSAVPVLLCLLLSAAALVGPRAIQLHRQTGRFYLTATGNAGTTLFSGFYYPNLIPLQLVDEEAIRLRWSGDIGAMTRNLPPMSPIEMDRFLIRVSVARIGRHPIDYLERVASRAAGFWYQDYRVAKTVYNAAFHFPLLLLAALGARRLSRSPRTAVAPLVAWIVFLNLLFAAVHANVRYCMPAIPCLAILAAAAIHGRLVSAQAAGERPLAAASQLGPA